MLNHNPQSITEHTVLKATIGSELVLENASCELISRCLRANTFANPIYVSNEQAGRSNWNTDSIITVYHYSGERLVLPRGYVYEFAKTCKEFSNALKIVDNRSVAPCNYHSQLIGVTLRPYQIQAIDEAMQFEQGVIISPTGSGKSLIGLEIIRHRRQKTLILIHRGELAKQWINVIADKMGIKAGFIGDGQWDVGNEITVAMVQTLAAKENEAKTLYNTFGLILLDECHHVPSSSFFNVIGRFAAKFRYGLSATPQRRDGLEPLIYRIIGPAIATITKDEVEQIGGTVPTFINVIHTGFAPSSDSWHDYQTALSTNERRNKFIVNGLQNIRGPILVLVDRTKHAEYLSKLLSESGISHTLAHGKLPASERNSAVEAMHTSYITIGTTSLIGEGFDCPRWSTLILGSPISSEIKLLQAIGRITRASHGKISAVVYDMVDNCAFSGSSFKKRLEIYKKHKILVKFPEKIKPLEKQTSAA